MLSPNDLAQQVWYMKSIANQYGVHVSISDMQYGFTVQGDAQVVLDAVDVVHASVFISLLQLDLAQSFPRRSTLLRPRRHIRLQCLAFRFQYCRLVPRPHVREQEDHLHANRMADQCERLATQ